MSPQEQLESLRKRGQWTIEGLLDLLLEYMGGTIMVESALDVVDLNWRESTATQAAIPKFVAALKDKDTDTRIRAARALRIIGIQAAGAVSALVEALQTARKAREGDVLLATAQALEELGSGCPVCGSGLECVSDADYSGITVGGSSLTDDVYDTGSYTEKETIICTKCRSIISERERTVDIYRSYYSMRDKSSVSEWTYKV